MMIMMMAEEEAESEACAVEAAAYEAWKTKQ